MYKTERKKHSLLTIRNQNYSQPLNLKKQLMILLTKQGMEFDYIMCKMYQTYLRRPLYSV